MSKLICILFKHSNIYFLMKRCSSIHTAKAAQGVLPLGLIDRIKTRVSETQDKFIQQVLCEYSQPSFLKRKMELQQTAQRNAEEEKKEVGAACSKDEPSAENTHHTLSAEAETGDGARSKNKRRRNQLSACSDEPESTKRERPNYFVAVQITDMQILNEARRIQDGILEASDVDISSTRIDPIKFHLTLMVMHLPDKQAVERAKETVEKLGPIIAGKLEGREVVLEFQGLSVFGGGRVVFSYPQQSQSLDDLHTIAEEVKQQMSENGIQSPANEHFKPHLTLFKFKNDKHLFKQGIRKIKASLYEPYKDSYLGRQLFTTVQLCEMSEDKREDGYYRVVCESAWQE